MLTFFRVFRFRQGKFLSDLYYISDLNLNEGMAKCGSDLTAVPYFLTNLKINQKLN